MESTKTKKKCPFFKLVFMCFPALQKKPNKQQMEIIETINEGIDQIQDAIELELQNNVAQQHVAEGRCRC